MARNVTWIPATWSIVLAGCISSVVVGQDVLTVVVNRANAVAPADPLDPIPSLGTFGYDPTGPNGGTIYTISFGASGTLRKVENVDGAQTWTTMVTQGAWSPFMQGGVAGASGGQPVPSGILLNPVAVGARPAYSFAVIADASTAVSVSGGRRNDLMQRFYEYNLNAGPGNFTSLVTREEIAIEVNATPTLTITTADNIGRQFAWSSNGESIYYADSGSGTNPFGGIYKVNVAAGSVDRLLVTSGANFEPTVIANGGVDRILLPGSAASGNAGGLDYFDDDGTPTPTTFIAANTIRDFLERSTADADIRSSAIDSDGNVYFYDQTTLTLVRQDSLGRLSKVTNKSERNSIGSANNNMLRLQPRDVMHPNGFEVTQILYAEQGSASLIGGAYVFQPGDFNRDNGLDGADLALFHDKVGVRGGAQVAIADYKFDLNGNNIVDWKDVKILQTFLPGLHTGDVNFDLAVNFDDLDIMAANYLGTGKTWVLGDIASRGTAANNPTDDFSLIDPLYTITGSLDKDIVNLTDLYAIAETWLNVLGQTRPTFVDLEENGYAGQFRLDMITAFQIVPEPASAVLLLTGLAFVGRVYRARRKVA